MFIRRDDHMSKIKLLLAAVLTVALFSTSSFAAGNPGGLELRLSFIPAAMDIGDWYEGYLERDYGGPGRAEADVFVMPVGVSAAYRWDMSEILEGGFVYADLGPGMVMLGDASFWMVPIGGGVGLELAGENAVSVYGKLGLRYPFAGGDAVDSTSPGLLLAGGVQFGQSENIKWFVEGALDNSSISFSDSQKSEDIDLGFILSIGLKFN
jgi:hypothetical protein